MKDIKELNEVKENIIIPYLTLRDTIGCIGCLLSPAVFLGSYIKGYLPFLPTVSAYYHSNSGDIFVGGLMVCGLFLISYKGYPEPDNPKDSKKTKWFRKLTEDFICSIAGVSIMLTALFATKFPKDFINSIGYSYRFGEQGRECLLQIINPKVTGGFHVTFAVITFISLGAMSFFKFSRNVSKNWRRVFQGLGIGIGASLLLIGLIIFVLPNKDFLKYELKLIFWLETLILVLFGISWLLKGKIVKGWIDRIISKHNRKLSSH